MLYFIFVEVPQNLFVANAWLCLPLYACGRWLILRRITTVVLAVAGAVNTIHMYIYYSRQLVTTGSCTAWTDLRVNLMTRLWMEDYYFLYVPTCTYIIVEGVRFGWSRGRIATWCMATVVGGVETVTPVLLLVHYVNDEMEFAKNVSRPTRIRRYHWLYAIQGFVSVCAWFPALLEWAVTRGTIAGQLADGLVTVSGTRATIAVMLCAFVWGIYFIFDVRIAGTGPRDRLLSWMLRLLTLFVLYAHMAAAVALILMYREFTPSCSYVDGDHLPVSSSMFAFGSNSGVTRTSVRPRSKD